MNFVADSILIAAILLSVVTLATSRVGMIIRAFAAQSCLVAFLPWLLHEGNPGFHQIVVLVTRTKAVTQVVGYLFVENGIYLFGVSLVAEMPVLVEMGILLDVFVGVFVMGIVMFRINREFDHLDTQNLTALKD